jgi:hypothetical protein
MSATAGSAQVLVLMRPKKPPMPSVAIDHCRHHLLRLPAYAVQARAAGCLAVMGSRPIARTLI